MVNYISTVSWCCMQKREGYSKSKNFCAVLILRGSFFDFNFWRKFEIIFKILLGHESGTQGWNMSEKN